MNDTITGVSGILVGHHTDLEAATGCTVVLCEEGAVAGVDVRGSAPGTRETDLMRPIRLVEKVHAVVLTGGSAFGLDAACGVMRYLEDRRIGFDVGVARVPIVAAAVLFDLTIGSPTVRPDADAGYAACQAATSDPVPEGTVGAGTGATVGKALGPFQATKSGIGSAAVLFPGGLAVGALVAVNAFGEVTDPRTGEIIAGVRNPNGNGFLPTLQIFREGAGSTPAFPTNTTIGVVATNAVLTKEAANKIAQMAHDGLARVIHPVHTMWDGDTVFALATGTLGREVDTSLLGTFVAEVMARAVVRAVQKATSLAGIPAPCDLAED